MIKSIFGATFICFSHPIWGDKPGYSNAATLCPDQTIQKEDPENETPDQKVEVQNRIDQMNDFALRARFTPEELKEFNAKRVELERQLAVLEKENPQTPTFNEWMREGKKIPPGMMFTGGSPWFNETTGQKRLPREVYAMIYGTFNTPDPTNPTGTPSGPPAYSGKRKPFPHHWGDPPKKQTKDLRPLPGGYGMGSGTLARWIQKNLDKDKKNNR